jgi:hypothetical protein
MSMESRTTLQRAARQPYFQPARIPEAHQSTTASDVPTETQKTSFVTAALIAIFIITIFSPFYFSLGSLRLSGNRVLLALAVFPCMLIVLSGRRNGIKLADMAILAYCMWAGASFFKAYGTSASLEPAGSLLIEVAGSYFLARALINSSSDFTSIAKFMFWIIAILLPVLIYEFVTGNPIVLQTLKSVLPVHGVGRQEMRMGFFRVQGTFEHPILYGTVCSSAFALCLLAYPGLRTIAQRLVRSGVVGFAVLISLSAGAYVSLAAQGGFFFLDRIFRAYEKRWVAFAVMLLVLYIGIDLLSNRSPMQVFASYLSFDAHTAYNRVLIWEYGTAEVARHPIFGIALNDWTRPEWMVASVDNFWLLRAMRHGLPALFFLVLAYGATVLSLARVKDLSAQEDFSRQALLLVLGGLAISLFSVDFWNTSQSLLFFLLGSGAWLVKRKVASA